MINKWESTNQNQIKKKHKGGIKIIAKYMTERDNNHITYKELIQIVKKTYS